MEKYNIENDIKVFGYLVPHFPNGIGETFDKLVSLLPKGDARPYYGISECKDNKMVYIAAALQTFDGEGAKYGCEVYTVERGEYLAETVSGWMQKTGSIKDVFMRMLRDERADDKKPCVEIYKNDDEMMCLVKAKTSNDLARQIEDTFDALINQLSLFEEKEINKIPFEGSWTAGQVAQHMILSNGGLLEMLNGAVKDTERSPDQHVEGIKTAFLDFTIKMESPDFILPGEKNYNKAELLSSLTDIKEGIARAAEGKDLSKTCVSFEIPVLGFLTRLEAIYFSIYHTQRHTHQLRNIYKRLQEQHLRSANV